MAKKKKNIRILTRKTSDGSYEAIEYDQEYGHFFWVFQYKQTGGSFPCPMYYVKELFDIEGREFDVTKLPNHKLIDQNWDGSYKSIDKNVTNMPKQDHKEPDVCGPLINSFLSEHDNFKIDYIPDILK